MVQALLTACYARPGFYLQSFSEGTHRRSVFFLHPLASPERTGATVPGAVAGGVFSKALYAARTSPHDLLTTISLLARWIVARRARCM